MNAKYPVRWFARRAAAIAAGALACAAAHAQWVWHDPSGVTTFSDTPPPSDVKPNDIVHQPVIQVAPPAGSDRSSGPSASNAPPPPGTNVVVSGVPGMPPPAAAPGDGHGAATGPKSYAEQDADFRKRIAEREKAEKKQAEEQAQANQKRAACEQARGYMQTLDSGTRLMRPDAEGNRTFLDDDQRAAERQKAQEAVDKNCGG